MSESLNLPNLIVIGAQKCGTTSLHYYLSLHPEIFMTKAKEVNYFCDDILYEKGVDWYLSNFESNFKINGDTSPNYTYYPSVINVASRMHSLIPDAKIIFMVRDPVERAISHYVHEYAVGAENRSFSSAVVDDLNNKYIERSKYALQLKQFLKYYELSSIKIIELEDLAENPHKTLEGVFEWLGVPSEFSSTKFRRVLHRSADKRRIKPFGRLLKLPYRLLRHLGELGWLLQQKILRPFSEELIRPQLDEFSRSFLKERLRGDVAEFRAICSREFSRWD